MPRFKRSARLILKMGCKHSGCYPHHASDPLQPRSCHGSQALTIGSRAHRVERSGAVAGVIPGGAGAPSRRSLRILGPRFADPDLLQPSIVSSKPRGGVVVASRGRAGCCVVGHGLRCRPVTRWLIGIDDHHRAAHGDPRQCPRIYIAITVRSSQRYTSQSSGPALGCPTMLRVKRAVGTIPQNHGRCPY